MIRSHFYIKVMLLLGIMVIVTTSSSGQNNYISLQEAVEIARKNYVGLEKDRLSIAQRNKMAQASLPLLPAQLSVSGEEFDFNKQSGVHSLNIQQNFYLPKAKRIQQAYYQSEATLAEKQYALTDQQLKREVEQAYYQLMHAKQEQELVAESIALYEDFLSVTTAQLEAGETGKIPQLSARSRLGQAKLEQEHALEQYQIALTLFNQWLQSDSTYDVRGELPLDATLPSDSIQQANPHLQVIYAQRELALAKVETAKAQLIPQINSGLRLQTASGVFPLFGYQLGLNIPLFKKSYNNRIEAAKIGVKVEEAALQMEQQQMERIISKLRYRLDHQLHILEYLRQDLSPIVNEQKEVNIRAYREGEIGYLEYLDGLEQVIKVRQQYLTALYQFNALAVELDYWMGK